MFFMHNGYMWLAPDFGCGSFNMNLIHKARKYNQKRRGRSNR